jgi:hypothetical protein
LIIIEDFNGDQLIESIKRKEKKKNPQSREADSITKAPKLQL